MREIVDYCRDHEILAQGRGSAANSAVCYCLGITAVDPVRMNLLFERFLSRERAEPPDIDLDIEHERREEVIQHVYARFGRSHAAMVANVIRYRARSAVRDVGKVLGIPETALARLAGLLSYSDRLDEAFLRRMGLDPHAGAQRHLLELVAEIQDAPRHLSIHPGGFLLGHEPVSTLVPIENATMEDRTVIQWDKNDIEALGLFKVDLLGLGELSHLHRCFDLLRETRGRDLSLATVPPDDRATYEMIGRADTVGVFQIESRAQMAMLPRLAPRNYYDLVIEVAIVRPGPIAGGMVHPYLKRRCGEEPIEYPHECLRPVLEKTLGIPLFQEQVMRLAVVAADYTPGEADQLRRDMAAWQRTGSIERHRERLVERMRAKGIATEFAERVYQQIQGFGEYGFPESHAASFALLSYVGAWVKRHYPAEFACGLLNAQPMGFYSPATILDDAKRHGVAVRPIDVRHSAAECTLERDGDDFAIRMGLGYVKGLGKSEIAAIVAARTRPFASLADFSARSRASTQTLARLAEAGALAGFEPQRRSALWQARGHAPDDAHKLLVPSESRVDFEPLDAFEEIGWDYVSAQHSTRGHPLEPLRAELAAAGLPCARDLARMKNGSEVSYAGLVICRQRPGTASGIVFMTLEDETGFANVVLFAHVFERQAELARMQPFLGVRGRLEVQSGVAHLIAQELWKPAFGRRPTEVGSRDFH
jgi:error-prone DNA polymerase